MPAISKREDQSIRLEKLVDLSTKALRNVFNILLPPDELPKKLETFKSSITYNISHQELNRLYPLSGVPVTSDDMDLTALVRVLRNTVIDEPLTGFSCLPKDSDISFAADVVRILFSRNKLYHTGFGKIKDQEYEDMATTLIEVIKRLGESDVDDQIRHIMTGSLDYRADSITWHAREAINLVPAALNKCVFQPAKASVIQLNEQQSPHYSIVLSSVMQNFSEFPSREELINYILRVQNMSVRQIIFILNEYTFLQRKIADLNSCQRKKDDSPTDKTPVDLSTEGNSTSPGLNNTINSYVPRLLSQSGQVKHTPMFLPRSCAVDTPKTNDKIFEKQLNESYNPFPCLKMVYKRLFEHKNSRCHLRFLQGYGSTDITTETERCNFVRSNFENNIDTPCFMEQNVPSSRQSSTYYTCSHLLQAHENVSRKHEDMVCVPPSNPFITSTPYVERNKNNNLSDNSIYNLSKSELVDRLYCRIWKKDDEPANKIAHVEPNVIFNFMRYLIMLMIFLFVLHIIVRELYPHSCDIFKSRLHAASLTALVVLLYLMFSLHIYINYM